MAYVFSPDIEAILARGPPVIDWDEISETLRLEYLGLQATGAESGLPGRPVLGTTADGRRVVDENIKGQFHCGEWSCLSGRNVTAGVVVRGPILRVGDSALGAVAAEGSVWWTFSAASALELNSMGIDRVRCVTSRSWPPEMLGVVYRGRQDSDSVVDLLTSRVFSLVLDTVTYVTVHRDDTTLMARAAGHMFENGGRVCGWASMGAECPLCLDTGMLHGVVPAGLAGVLEGDDYCVCAAGDLRVERDEVDNEIGYARAHGMESGRWLGRYDGGGSDLSSVNGSPRSRGYIDDGEEEYAQLTLGVSECGVDSLYPDGTPPVVQWPQTESASSLRVGGWVLPGPVVASEVLADMASVGLYSTSLAVSCVAPALAGRMKGLAGTVEFKAAVASESRGYCYLRVIAEKEKYKVAKAVGAWIDVDELLGLPFDVFDMTSLAAAEVVRVFDSTYHVLPLGTAGGQRFAPFLARRCVDKGSWQWSPGSLGSHIAVALAHDLESVWSHFSEVEVDSDVDIGGNESVQGDPVALSSWLEGHVPGLRDVTSVEDRVLMSKTMAVLNESDREALRVFEVLGDAALSLVVLDRAASYGLSVEACTKVKVSVVANDVLSPLFSKVVPHGLVSMVANLNPAKGRVGACVLESWIGLVYTRMGYSAVAGFCESLGVFGDVFTTLQPKPTVLKRVRAVVMPSGHGKTLRHGMGKLRDADTLCDPKATERLEWLRCEARTSGNWNEYSKVWGSRLRLAAAHGDVVMVPDFDVAEYAGFEVVGSFLLTEGAWLANLVDRPREKLELCKHRYMSVFMSTSPVPRYLCDSNDALSMRLSEALG